MKRILFLPCLILSVLVSCSKTAPGSSREMVLWYDEPAGEVWLDGLLIGNGYMGRKRILFMGFGNYALLTR